MTSPKKKLPTGPIRIDHPFSKCSEPSSSSSLNKESNDSDSFQDSPKPESRKQDSTMQEATLTDLDQENYLVQEVTGLDRDQQSEPSTDFSRTTLENSKIETRKQESSKLEASNTDIEYKKVAMRLSAKAVARLQSLRVTTGLPYEILVDVMICNWDSLPTKLQTQYLSEAKQARAYRLIAGQDKAMKTVRSRLIE
jgi:predicted DNA binding CopG/RHH family protein